MKRTYEAPELKLMTVSAEDMITTSGGGNAVLPDDEF